MAKRVGALLAIFLYLTIHLMAVSPRLHQAVEGPGANSPNDHCAATLLAKGHMNSVQSVTCVPEPPAFSFAVPVPLCSVQVQVHQRLPASRAPPTRF
jgi:hypothetical protein